MKFKVFLFATLLTTMAQAQAVSPLHPGVYHGIDSNGQPCQLVLQQVIVGRPRFKDACDFSMDGPGPWCNNAPKVPVQFLQLDGLYVTAAGRAHIAGSDSYATFGGAFRTSFGINSSEGVFSGSVRGRALEVYDAFLTPFGRTLSPQQKIEMLEQRAPGQSYEDVYKKIYADETCRFQI